MKFLIDMPLSPDLGVWLRDQGHDAVHAVDLHLEKSADKEILQRALAEGRIVITSDLDYPRLFTLLQLESPGLILFRGGNFSEPDTRILLERALSRVARDELESSVTVIEKNRIRKRALPIKQGQKS